MSLSDLRNYLLLEEYSLANMNTQASTYKAQLVTKY